MRWPVRPGAVVAYIVLGVTICIPDTDNARDYLAHIVVYSLSSPSVVL